jgi:cell division protein FtsI (penicillin-binding protein 3)
MKKKATKKGITRLSLLLAGLFFLAWAVAVIFAVGETFSRPHEKNDAPSSALLAGPGGTGGRFPILDRDRRELAVSFPMKSVYVRPLEVNDPGTAARFLARELGVDEKRLLSGLREERGFVWLGRQIQDEAGQKIMEANLQGVYVVDESQRFYPQDTLAAHVVGFVGEGHGLAGIEARYDRLLRGQADPLEQEGSAEALGPLVLTLDLRGQELLEKELAHLLRVTSAAGGCGLLLEAGSGEILALASQPTYDPNFFWEYDESGRVNRVVATEVPASGFRNLFRLAAHYQNGPPAKQDSEEQSARLTALKSELKLARLFEQTDEQPDRLVQQGERFLSPALASLEELEEVGDFANFIEELGIGRQSLAEAGTVKPGQPNDAFRLTGLELLTGLATLLNLTDSVAPHLVAGVLDQSTGKLQQNSLPVEKVVGESTVEKMRAYFHGLPSTSGGVTILEELTPATLEAEPGGTAGMTNQQAEDTPLFTTLLVALVVGEKSPPLLLLLALDEARVDPTTKTPMFLTAEKLLPRVRNWAAPEPSSPVWQPREKKWRSAWKSRQDARVGKSRKIAGVDREMPDLQGLSLRKALQVLNRYEMKVRVQGAGRVAGQQPGPGTVINGDQCLLKLTGLK